MVTRWTPELTQTIHLPAGVDAFTASHVYAESGAYRVTVRVRDDGGQEDTLSFTVRVIAPRYKLYMPLLQ